MTVLSAWLAWANVPYLTAVAIAVGVALLQVSGVLGLLAGGDHGDADGHDSDGDGVPDSVDTDADGDGDADGESESEGHHAVSVQGEATVSLVGLLGFGRAPMTFLLQTFAVAFAVAGLSVNTLVYGFARPPLWSMVWVIPIALVIGALCTRAMAAIAGKVFSTEGQEATSREGLVGSSGVVISSRVDREFGEVRIKDRIGHVVRVVCVTHDSVPIEEGREVVVVEQEQGRLVVSALDSVLPGRRRT
ncbi:MAG: DUF1449 family protein [Deltaproteobacteria bacterium]|nr:DUF1449 family protein [Deltaproteobacteria bacterium]